MISKTIFNYQLKLLYRLLLVNIGRPRFATNLFACFESIKVITSGGLAKNSEPIPFEYSCQVTSGVNKAMLSH